MVRRDTKLLQALVDGIQSHGTIANSCRMHGVSNGAFFNWAKLSKLEGGEEFMVLIGDEPMLFHEAIQMAQRQVSFEILENFRYRLLHGTHEVARFQGKTVYRRDPSLDHLSDKDLEDLAITSRYLRDANGEFIPEIIHHEPSVQATLAFLASEFPKQWGNKSTVEINQRSTGVQVVKHQYAQPKPLPVPVQEVAPVAAIEAPIIDVEPDDLSDILGEPLTEAAEPAPVAAPPVAEPRMPPPVAEPVAPPPAAPAKPLSDLSRDLLDRLARRPGGDRASAVMAPPVFRPEPDDLDPRRTGAGSGPPPGAIKVV